MSGFRFALLLSLLWLSAPALAAPPTLILRGDTTTTRNLAEGLAKAWAKHGGGHLQVQPFNTISGIDNTLSGKADIAGSARPAFSGRAKESRLNFTPVAWDALVLIAQHGNPARNLTLQQIYNIYLGRISRWNTVGGANQAIHLYSIASPLDGLEFDLRQFVYGRGNQQVAAPWLFLNTRQMDSAAGQDPLSLAVTAYSNVFHDRQVKMLTVEGMRPDAATIAAGRYPLYMPLYFATLPGGRHAAAVARFMAFLKTPAAAAVMRAHGLIPYAEGLALQQMSSQRNHWLAARIRAELSHGAIAMNGPLVPGATYSQGTSEAPASPATRAARADTKAAQGNHRDADSVY